MIKLLLIDDDDVDRQQIRRALRRSLQEVELVEAESGKEGLKLAREETFDCILLDYRLPGEDGLEVLHQMVEAPEGLTAPVVMLTVVADDALSIRSLREGATDFLTKDTLTPALLARAIINARERQELQHQRIEAENELRKKEAFLMTVVNSVPDALVRIDSGGAVLGLSYSATRMFGYAEEEFAGKGISLFLAPGQKERLLSFLREITGKPARKAAHPLALELLARSKDGREFPVEVSTGQIEGEEKWWILVLRDISERFETEAKLRQAQKMEAVGQLTGGIAHDFNNLLTAILGGLRLLEQEKPSGPTTEYLQIALDSTKRAAELTNRLLAFSRRQVLEPKLLDINQVVLGMDSLLKRTLGGNVKVHIHSRKGKLMCLVDGHELENAVLNLAINARDAMPSGGDLTIEISAVDAGPGRATRDIITPGRYALVTVSDTGLGMTEEVQRKALEPFFTTKGAGKGTGLGLSMVYGFVRQSGGHLNIYSEPGVGTTIKVYLPLTKKAAERVEPAAWRVPADVDLKGSVILLVEDDAGVRAFATQALKGQGYNVLVAKNGEEALQRIDKTKRIDLLVCDVIMPDEVSGTEVARKFQDKFEASRVLFCSGYPERILRNERRLGIRGEVLPKPYELTTLLAKVADNLLKGRTNKEKKTNFR